MNDFRLDENLEQNPMTVLSQWLEAAKASSRQPNPNSMTVATLGHQDGIVRPDARVVLCKAFHDEEGFLVFYTNYLSSKGEQLEQHPCATAVFHWDQLQLQARVYGPVVKSPSQESDDYFASRPRESQLGAWASDQSQPIDNRDVLMKKLVEVEKKYSEQPVPRPEHWGGYRLWAEQVELWTGAAGRLHDRAIWRRQLQRLNDFAFTADDWNGQRLQP